MKFEDIVVGSKDLIQNFVSRNKTGIVIIRGATATGKSKLSIQLADFFDIEIISSDSRQIFRKMNIGTDKVSEDVLARIPHHQINIVNPNEQYKAGEWQQDVKKQIKDIQSRNKIPFIVGGTGLYIDTIYKNFDMPAIGPDENFRKKMMDKEIKKPGYLHAELSKLDPKEAQKHHPNSTRYILRALEIFHQSGKTKSECYKEREVEQPILMIGIWRNKESTNELIAKRIKEMIKGGLVDEVKSLLDKGYTEDLQSMGGIGYKEVVGYLKGEYDIEEMENLLNKNTQKLAKKQRTWFRRYISDSETNPKKNVEYKVWYLN